VAPTEIELACGVTVTERSVFVVEPTVSWVDPVTPEVDAEIVAVPSPRPAARPGSEPLEDSTETTAAFEDDQATELVRFLEEPSL